MTKRTYLVTVLKVDLQKLREVLDAFYSEPSSDDPKARTRARILRAATDLFQRHGYRRTSVDEVALAAGVAKGTVYVHFKNKTELLYFAILEEKKQFLGPFRALLSDALDPTERLSRYLELVFTSIPRAPLGSRLMSGDREMLQFIEDLDPALRKQVQSTQQLGLHSLLSGVGAYDLLSKAEQDERAHALTGMLYAAAQMVEERVRGDVDLARYARQLAKIIVHGVGAP